MRIKKPKQDEGEARIVVPFPCTKLADRSQTVTISYDPVSA